MVLDPNGASGDVEFALQAVKSARIEALVGGGRLELEREEGAPDSFVLLQFTGGQIRRGGRGH